MKIFPALEVCVRLGCSCCLVKKLTRSCLPESVAIIEPYNPCTTRTKAMMNMGNEILEVVYILLFSCVLTVRTPSLKIPLSSLNKEV